MHHLLDESNSSCGSNDACISNNQTKKNILFAFKIHVIHKHYLFLKTRAEPSRELVFLISSKPNDDTFSCLIQNPDTFGEIADLRIN